MIEIVYFIDLNSSRLPVQYYLLTSNIAWFLAIKIEDFTKALQNICYILV